MNHSNLSSHNSTALTSGMEHHNVETNKRASVGQLTSSLDLLCSSMDIPTPKDGEVTGEKVHTAYWVDKKLKEITEYCEKDVAVLIDIIKKFKNLEQ